jgi:Fe2+ transport system protein B
MGLFMSSGEFHVHGPHDHHLEHAQKNTHAESDPMVNRIALFTALIATLGAVVNFYSSSSQIDALSYKNEAIYQKNEASEQVEILQGEGVKKAIAELSLGMVTEEQKPAIRTQIAQYEAQQETLRKRIEEHEREAKKWEQKSEEQLHAHHDWEYSSAALQVAVALAAVALISRRRWVEVLMFMSGGSGAAIAFQHFWKL